MINRILTGWTIMRAFYLLAGGIIVIQSIIEHQWIGLLFGGYFAAMGLFAFGCAGGNCSIDHASTKPRQKSNLSIEHVDYEDVNNS